MAVTRIVDAREEISEYDNIRTCTYEFIEFPTYGKSFYFHSKKVVRKLIGKF